MGDSLRDYYLAIYKKAGKADRKKLRESYAAYTNWPGGETLHSRAFYEKAGYRPPSSQMRLNWDG